MSRSRKGSDSPTSDVPDVRNVSFDIVKERDDVSQPISRPRADSTHCLPPSTAAIPIVTPDLPPTTSIHSAPDEGTTFESTPGELSSATNISNRTEVAAQDGGPISEIQNIMCQFDKDGIRLVGEGDRSPTLPVQVPFLGASFAHPPRKSSLEPLHTGPDYSNSLSLPRSTSTTDKPHIPNKWAAGAVNGSQYLQGHSSASSFRSDRDHIISPSRPDSALSQAVIPPDPDTGPDLSFDFHRFLEQLRHRTADPVAKFLRSFLVEFGKKKWMAHEQGKIISDFLAFIQNKMAVCEVWRGLSDIEFDNAKEGMEKLVMNRLYSQTFSPAIPSAVAPLTAKSKQKTSDKLLERERTGQHQEDIERDEILSQKVRIYGWVREEHLDIFPVGDGGLRFLALAQKGM